MLKAYIMCLILAFPSCSICAQTTPASVTLSPVLAGSPAVPSPEYARLQKKLQQGWNTWDTNTIAGEVLLQEGLEVRLGLKHNGTVNGERFLPTMLIGRQEPSDEKVKPGPHAYDGSYNSFEVTWAGLTVNVQAAHAGDDLVMLVSPVGQPTVGSLPGTAIFSLGFLWNRPGQVRKEAGYLIASAPGKNVTVYLA